MDSQENNLHKIENSDSKLSIIDDEKNKLPTVDSEENKSQDKENKLKPILILTVLAVALGTNFGIYNSSVVNNLEPSVFDYINQTGEGSWISSDITTVWSVVVSMFTAGTALGTLCSPFLAEYFGRK